MRQRWLRRQRDVGAARVGGRHNEANHEEKPGGIDQRYLYLGMSRVKGRVIGASTVMPFFSSQSVSPGNVGQSRAPNTPATASPATSVAGGGLGGSREAVMRASIRAGNAGAAPTSLPRYTASIN